MKWKGEEKQNKNNLGRLNQRGNICTSKEEVSVMRHISKIELKHDNI